MADANNVCSPLVKDGAFELPDKFDVEPIVGWRGWQVLEVLEFVALGSVSHTSIHWPKRVAVTATCQRPTGDNSVGHPGVCPALGCVCGVYARGKSDGFPEWAAAGGQISPFGGSRCWGTVSLWGRLVEHADGWRAQFAYPKELHLLPALHKHERTLVEEYGVSVVLEP